MCKYKNLRKIKWNSIYRFFQKGINAHVLNVVEKFHLVSVEPIRFNEPHEWSEKDAFIVYTTSFEISL